jgi:hypothetical protein
MVSNTDPLIHERILEADEREKKKVESNMLQKRTNGNKEVWMQMVLKHF